jgi:hypothetical protein
MLSAVDFNDQQTIVTAEINNEPSDRHLAAETQAVQPMRTQCGPQVRFSVRHLTAEIFCAAALNGRNRPMGGFLATPLPDRFAVRPPPQGGR